MRPVGPSYCQWLSSRYRRTRFFDLLAAAGNPDAALRAAHASYRLGYHKAARLALLAQQFRLLAVTGLQPHDHNRLSEPFRTRRGIGAAQANLGLNRVS